MTNNTNETLWGGLLSDKSTVLFLGAGLLLLLCNIIIFFGGETRPSNWLFYLDIRHWSVYVSIALWIATLWLVAEAADFMEDYLSYIRMFAAAGFMLLLIFGLRDLFNAQGLDPRSQGLSTWYSIATVITVFCAIRSLYLLYVYKHEGAETIDMEEATWFWGVSGFLFTVLLLIGLASIIPLRWQNEYGIVVSTTLYRHCYSELQILLRNGAGTLWIRILAFLILTSSVAFVYVAGKWALIFLARIRGE